MIRYPVLNENAGIGVTAPSSGVPDVLHTLVNQASKRLKSDGFSVTCGDTVWTEVKSKSAPSQIRADEFNRMIQDDRLDLIIPPWGGELLIEMLDRVDYERLPEKWVLGYSDVSALLLAITLKTGIATAHGTNLIDLRGEYSDPVTAMWQEALETRTGETVIQHSSEKFQLTWDHDHPSPHVFHLNEPTEWKTLTLSGEPALIEGRLLGGCIDVIHHLAGTPYGWHTLWQSHSFSERTAERGTCLMVFRKL